MAVFVSPSPLLPRHLPHLADATHEFLVSFDEYSRDLLPGMRSEEEARRQAEMDLPRCSFRVDPTLSEAASSDVASLVRRFHHPRFLTQAVFALPLEWLMGCGLQAREATPPTPMLLRVRCPSSCVSSKRLLLHQEGRVVGGVRIRVFVDARERYVRVQMRTRWCGKSVQAVRCSV